MKIYISVDMEGMPGTFNWEHEKKDRSAVLASMNRHLETAITAITSSDKESEITEICIADSHGDCDNLSYELSNLDSRVTMISGAPRPEYMMPGFSSDFDLVFLLGYHAGTGALKGNMDHSYSNSRIQKIHINDMPMNEALINAAYAGYHNVPVALVSGDLALEKELSGRMPWIEYVRTKEGISKFSAKNYSQKRITNELAEKVRNALSKENLPCFRIDSPINLKIELHSTAMADQACLMPNVVRLDGKTISYTENDFAVLLNALMAIITLAESVGI
nr:D-amino peptidase [Candidatus Cloacimonadota bacterium]